MVSIGHASKATRVHRDHLRGPASRTRKTGRGRTGTRVKKALKPSVALALSVLVLLTALLWAGCGDGESDGPETGDAVPEARELEVRTLAHGMISQYGRGDESATEDETRPECEVITRAEDLEMLLKVASLQEEIPPVDLERELVLAVLQGPKRTGGYAVSVSRVTQKGSLVEVRVEVVEPEPGSITIQILTSPYHLVTLDRDAFNPRGQLRFVFLDEQDNLLEEVLAEV